MKVVCISDTHGDHRQLQLPAGDVLVHAGDITAHGSEQDYLSFLAWFGGQNFRHRLFVAGNHDTYLETNAERASQLATEAGVVYLNDSGHDADGVRFWGSPITPRFHDWAFMRDPGPDIERHWDRIPQDTDVLITHGPPSQVMDLVERSETESEHTGCESLEARLRDVKPRFHVFGHIHEGYGRLQQAGITYLNVSSMNKYYLISNPPVCFELSAIR